MRRGTLIVIAGPSGVGKGTVIQRLLSRIAEGPALSVSVTTRAPRPGEIEGVHYRFVTDQEFDRMIADGSLLEWAEIVGHRSGTPRRPVEERLELPLPTLLEPRKRAERALVAVVQEAYVHGVSTRRVDDLVKSLGMTGISKSQVSRLCQELDEEVTRFRHRRLDGPYPYVWLDATYLKVRRDGRVQSMAVVIAIWAVISGMDATKGRKPWLNCFVYGAVASATFGAIWASYRLTRAGPFRAVRLSAKAGIAPEVVARYFVDYEGLVAEERPKLEESPDELSTH